MKLIAEIKGEQKKILIKREDNKILAEIDNRKYHLEASEPEPNVFVLKNEGKIYEVFVSPKVDTGELHKVKIGVDDFEINIIDPKKLRGSNAGSDSADGVVEIKTAMPGKVVKILLNENDQVNAGDGVIIVEAMKMQNEMKSQKDGLIKEIRFVEGDTVNAGDVLVIIE